MPRLVLRVNYGGAKVWRALHYVTKGKRVSILTTYKLGVSPPGAKWHDQTHRPRWIGLRPTGALHGRQRGSTRTTCVLMRSRSSDCAESLRALPYCFLYFDDAWLVQLGLWPIIIRSKPALLALKDAGGCARVSL
jgi:hypothetical protein